LVIHRVATTKAVNMMMAVQLVACLAALPTSPPAASTGAVAASATAPASHWEEMRCFIA
jgi:Flp pilus assembly protein TadD